jgi:hypothetical protein
MHCIAWWQLGVRVLSKTTQGGRKRVGENHPTLKGAGSKRRSLFAWLQLSRSQKLCINLRYWILRAWKEWKKKKTIWGCYYFFQEKQQWTSISSTKNEAWNMCLFCAHSNHDIDSLYPTYWFRVACTAYAMDTTWARSRLWCLPVQLIKHMGQHTH